MRVVKLLAGCPSRTVGELIDETGVTRTAVTEQLNELLAAGFIERNLEYLVGRGRPRHRYSATLSAMVLLFANNQKLVVPAIWKAVHAIGGEKLTKRVLRSVSRSLAKHYKEKITATDPKKRIVQYAAILEAEGGLVDLSTKGGHLTVTKRTCAFIGMFDNNRNVCEIDIRLMAAIAGCPVRQTSCRNDGAPCCQFEVDTKSAGGSPMAKTATKRSRS